MLSIENAATFSFRFLLIIIILKKGSLLDLGGLGSLLFWLFLLGCLDDKDHSLQPVLD